MGSEFRRQKYHHVFNSFLDSSKDGYIDIKDFDILLSKMSQIRGWNPKHEQYQYYKNILYKILENLLEELDSNKDGRVSLEEWTALYDNYTKAPSKSPKWQTLYEDLSYEYLHNEKSTIDKDEYVKVLSFFGFEADNVAKAFDKMSKGKSTISEPEFRQLWREFFTSDDPEAPGNALCAFKN